MSIFWKIPETYSVMVELLWNKQGYNIFYVNTCKKEINEVNSLLEPIQQEYGIIFPIRSYEEGIFKNYPIILKSFNFTDEEMIQEFMINAMFFAESSFDYLVVLFCDENNYVYNPFLLPVPLRRSVHKPVRLHPGTGLYCYASMPL